MEANQENMNVDTGAKNFKAVPCFYFSSRFVNEK